jgi:hypothetical protein
MKFILEVDIGENSFDGKTHSEMGRILRYWGSNLQHFDMKPGDGSAIYDSEYREVGNWRIVEAEPAGE